MCAQYELDPLINERSPPTVSRFPSQTRPEKRKYHRWWDKREITGAARKLLCAGLFLKDSPKPHGERQEVVHKTDPGADGVIIEGQGEQLLSIATFSVTETTDEEEDDSIDSSTSTILLAHEDMEEYIDNMTLDCEEALEVWAGFYGADLYGTRMSAEQVARLNDYCTDETFYNPNSCSNGASCRTP